MGKINVGIIGSTGYVGVELLRLLSNHSGVHVNAIGSNSFVGSKISEIYQGVGESSDLVCMTNEDVIEKSDFIFTALPHGVSEKYVIAANRLGKKVVDLSADFRLEDEKELKKWYGIGFIDKGLHEKCIYGLSEINREKIRRADVVANPGCYPTSISLALIPLLEFGSIKDSGIIIDSKSGLTGSGRELSQASHFVEVNENVFAYKVGNHRHTPEIEQNLSKASGTKVRVVFTPTIIPVNRGILSTIYCSKEDGVSIDDIYKKLTEYYSDCKFIEILPLGQVSTLKNTRYSNKCAISIHENNGSLVICSTIDNMIKGAAGQAIQNMNLMLGFDEEEGLKYIPAVF
ncbi:MAG: N-acetyl-gamma-glutamyl-phosphate reductase [Clostridioides sp.]|nr:N-acetyl-gamma-glutamyl-phosphate reductase [Clostridioides sp.]